MHNWRDLVWKRLADAGIDRIADSSLVEELAQHMEDRYADAQARGGSADEALAVALSELDHHERLAPLLARNQPVSVPPAPVGGPPLRSPLAALWQDFRYAARTLRRSPGFTIATVVTVALSTAPTIALLSIGNWLFLRPVPGLAAPERLTAVSFGVPNEDGLSVVRPSYEHIARLAPASPSIDSMAGWQRNGFGMVVGSHDGSFDGEFVSGNYFDVLGVRMFAGRSFFPDEDRPPDGTLVAVISYRLSRVFFDDGSAVGARVTINRHPVTVIGVAPPGFSGSGSILDGSDIWMPGHTAYMLQHQPPKARRPDRGPFYQYVIRLASGASPEHADTQLRNALQALAQNDPAAATLRNVQPRLRPGFAAPADDLRSAIAALLGLGILLVLIAAANLTNMFGFRAVRRVPETALRRALGASSLRLFQASMAESVIVATIGCLAGLVVVSVAQTLVGGIFLGGFYIPEIPFDWRLMGMTVALAFCTGIFMGASSARFSIRRDLAAIIGGSGRTITRTVSRLRTALAVVQMALSLTLLVGALLFISTLRNLWALDPGFDRRALTTYTMSFRTQGYTPERISLFFSELLERLSRTPGITATAVASGSPLLGGDIGMVPSFNPLGLIEKPRYVFSQVSTGYFDALGVSLIAGQGIAAAETFRPGSETAVVLSESLARHLYGTTAAVGRLLTIPKTLVEPQHDVRIVGVAEDVRWSDLAGTPPFMIYRPIQTASSLNSTLLVRSADRTDRVISRVRDEVKSLDPRLPMFAQVMEDVVSRELGQQRTFAWVLGLLAAMGFALAAIGIYGLVSQSTVERTREFGIRLAVGADPRDIVRLVLRSALFIVAVGVPLGCALAVTLALALRSRLFGVTPLDPVAYIASIGALVVVVLAAGLWPAYSASRGNPADVLRAE